MDLAFRDQNLQSFLIYMDNILVFGSAFKQTLIHLEMVLVRLAEFNLKIKPEKCNLFRFVPGYAKIAGPLHELLGCPSKMKKKRTAPKQELKPPVLEAWDDT